jgi:hypothetical protein
VRPGSERKAPAGCQIVVGDPRDAATFVELVGVTHSNPAKAAKSRAIDLNSALAGLSAARDASVQHSVYVSAALPAPAPKFQMRQTEYQLPPPPWFSALPLVPLNFSN